MTDTAASSASRAGRPPHVVWIMADQLRADAVGFNGNAIVRTPNLDRLAKRGVVFDQLYCQSSVCIPSRACMLTGRYLRNLGMDNGSSPMSPAHATLPELFQRAGYRTGLFGKLHITPQQYTRDTLGTRHAITDAGPFLEAAGMAPMPDDPAKHHYGFQHTASHEDALWGDYADWLAKRDPALAAKLVNGRWPAGDVWRPAGHPALRDVGELAIDPALHPSWFVGESAGDWFEAHAPDGPCFMHVSFVDPHHPWDPPADVLRDYPADAMPLPACRDAGNVIWPPTLAGRTPDFAAVDDAHTRLTIACYYAMVDQIDRSVGRLLDAIERAGEMDNTLFVFVADHGELLGDYGLWRKGSFHYDCIIRVPGFVSYPAAWPGGGRIEGLVETIDLAPTVLSLAGLAVPEAMQGRDLAGPIRRGDPVGLGHVWCELFTTWNGPYVDCWTVRTPTAKLNWYPRDRAGHLFDLTADPLEQRDLFADPARRPLRDEMLATMLQSICEQKDPLPRVLSQY